MLDVEWVRNESSGDVSGSSHELPCLSKEEELNMNMSIGHFWGVIYKIRGGLDGGVVRSVSCRAWSQAAPVDRWQWDLCGERDFAEQTLVRVHSRLTTCHQKFYLLQEITEKLFQPWVRLQVPVAFSYTHSWKVRNDTFPQEGLLCKETQRESWNMVFHIFRRLMTWEIHLVRHSLPSCPQSGFPI